MKSFTKVANNSSNEVIINLMKNALKEEINAWYGYIMIKEWLSGPERENIANFYEEAAKDELEDHGYWLMKRITQLGGSIEDITVSPNSLSSSVHKYISPIWDGDKIDVRKSLDINIQNEEGAIETYKELVSLTDGVDPASNSKLKQILADEEEHLQELKDFKDDIS